MAEKFQETALVEAGDIAGDGSFPVRFITAGWGSSGYYSADVIEAAAPLFKTGMPMFLDHATASEKLERPIRSVKDIAATVTEAGTYNPAEKAIEGRATLVPGPYREAVKALKSTIGLSINGGGAFREGEAEGRSGRIVESLDEITSTDFVTRPGRGGKMLEAVLESALLEAAVLDLHEAAVSDKSWSDFSDGDFSDTQYARSCVLDRGGDDAAKERYSLPVREPSGTLNRAAVHAAAGMLGKVTGASAEVKKAAAKKLVSLYRGQLKEDPPEALLKAAGGQASESALAEATASDRMEHLRTAVRDEHGGTGRSAWVRDQDAEKRTVWFDVHDHRTDGSPRTFQQGYRVGGNDVDVELVGKPTAVRAVTQYVPVSPAGPTPTKESKEDTMATTQIEEAEHNRLLEEAGRVPTLEAERDTEKARADKAEGERDQLRARESATEHARKRVTEANKDLPAATVTRIVSEATRSVPLTDKGELDEAALDTAVDDARTAEESYLAGLAQASGAGKITGFGVHVQEGGDAITWDDIDEAAGLKTQEA